MAERMRLDWQLRSACGYAELGMDRESMAELNAISKEEQDRPEVLLLRLHNLMHRKSWARALGPHGRIARCATIIAERCTSPSRGGVSITMS